MRAEASPDARHWEAAADDGEERAGRAGGRQARRLAGQARRGSRRTDRGVAGICRGSGLVCASLPGVLGIMHNMPNASAWRRRWSGSPAAVDEGREGRQGKGAVAAGEAGGQPRTVLATELRAAV